MFKRTKDKIATPVDKGVQSIAPEVKQKSESSGEMPRSVYLAVLEHRNALRVFVTSLANFKMLGNDMLSLELLAAKKGELGKNEEQLKRSLRPEALKSAPALEKLSASATNALHSFYIFTKGNIEKLQDVHRGFNVSAHDKQEYWMGNVIPVYREYMQKKLSYINESYDELNKIDNFIERLKLDFKR